MSLAGYLHRPSLNPYSIHARTNNDAYPGTRSGKSNSRRQAMQPSRISTSKSKGLTDPSLWVDRDVVAYVRDHYEKADASSLTALIREFRISPLGLWYLQTDLEELLRLANGDTALQNLVLDLAAHVRPVVSPTTPRRIHVKQLSKDLDVPPPPPPPPPLDEESEHEEEDEDLARSVVSDWALEEMPEEAFDQPAHEDPADQYDDHAQEGGVQGLGLDTMGGEETFHDTEPVAAAAAQEDLIDLENEEEAEGQGASEVPIHDSQPSDEEFFEPYSEDAPAEGPHFDEDTAHSIHITEVGPSEDDGASYEPPEDETEAARTDLASGAAASTADVGESSTIAGAETRVLEQEEEEENPFEEESLKKDLIETSGDSPELEVEIEDVKPSVSVEETDVPAQPVVESEAPAHTESVSQSTGFPDEELATEEPEQGKLITSPSPDASSEQQGTSTPVGDAVAAADTTPQTTEQEVDVTDPKDATQPAAASAVQPEEVKSSELETQRGAPTEESTSQETIVDQQTPAPEAAAEAPAAAEDTQSTPPEPETSTTKTEAEAEAETDVAAAEGDKLEAQEEGERKENVDSTSQSRESQGSPGAGDSGASGKPALTVSVPPTVATPPPPASAQTPAPRLPTSSQGSPAPATPKTTAWGKTPGAWGAVSGPSSIFTTRKAAVVEPAPAPSPSRTSSSPGLWPAWGLSGMRKTPSIASPSPSPSTTTPPSRTPGGAGASNPWASASPAIRTSSAPKDEEKPASGETPANGADEQSEDKQQEAGSSPVPEDVGEQVSEALGESILDEPEQAERARAAGAEGSKDTPGELADVGAGETEKSDGGDVNANGDDGEGGQAAAKDEVVEGDFVNITATSRKKRRGRKNTSSANTSTPQTPDRAASPPPSRTRTVTGASVDAEEKPATPSQDALGNQAEGGEANTPFPQNLSRDEIKRLRKLRKEEAKRAKTNA